MRNWTHSLAVALSSVALVGASAASADAANECQVSYTYTAGAGPSAVPQVAQTQVSANATKTINQGAMRYVVNDRDWPAEVEVTTIGGGTKWVQLLEKGKRDPASGNYVGGIELRRVKCLPGGKAGGSSPGDAGTQSLAAIVDKAYALLKAQAERDMKLHQQMMQMMKAEVESAKKTADQYIGCPSPAAQAQYDDLERTRQQAVVVRDTAQAAELQAAQALASCRQVTGNSPACGAAHSTLPFTVQRTTAVAAIASIDGALTALRSLKCVSGCGQTAKIWIRPGAVLGRRRYCHHQVLRARLQRVIPGRAGRAHPRARVSERHAARSCLSPVRGDAFVSRPGNGGAPDERLGCGSAGQPKAGLTSQ
jgi:hypothetical protein